MTSEARGSWQPDPYGGASWRWWDGTAWGAQTAPADPNAGFAAPIRSAVGSQVALGREDAATEGDLMLGAQRVGYVHKPNFSSGQGDCAEGSWMFEGNPMVERREIRVLPSGQCIATFQWGGGGFFAMPGSHGSLVFADGRRFGFPRTPDVYGRSGGLMGDIKAMATADWTVIGPTNVPLLRSQFGLSTDGYHRVGAGALWIDVYPPAAEVFELPLLILLTAYVTFGMASSNEARRRLRNADQGF